MTLNRMNPGLQPIPLRQLPTMSQPSIRLEPTDANIAHCADLLRRGEVVGVPTETVYGLAGNALNESCARKIFEVKGRPFIDPLIAHFPSLEASLLHIQGNEAVDQIAAAFWPGPLTIVANKHPSIPDIVTAGLPSAAIRVPGHPVLRKLLAQLDFPLAAPSANPFGYVSPTRAEHVERTLGERISAVLDAGPCDIGVESTILDLRDPEAPAILRHGPISAAQVREVLGREIADRTITNDDESQQTAPGQLSAHYSPNTKVLLLENGFEPSQPLRESSARLLQTKPAEGAQDSNVFWLSDNGSTEEVAHNLFNLLQRLDQQNFEHIEVELSPAEGIGKAINDRLRRAAAKLG